jgi:POT family proton-dependent oligopeptide transporter
LTTVNEKTIVESKSFQNSNLDKNFKVLLSKEEFISQLEEGSVEGLMVDSSFVSQLNKATNGAPTYHVSTVTVSESLLEADKYSGTKKEKMKNKATVAFLSATSIGDTTVNSMEDLNKLMESSAANKVASVIKNESLNKGLSVFGLLGWVAVGCGILLVLLGSKIKQWMHGIN